MIARTRIYLALLGAVMASAGGIALVITDSGSGAARPDYVTVSALPGVDLAELQTLPGLSATSGPFPSIAIGVSYGGRVADVVVEGRAVRRAAVGEPQVIRGSWARAGTIVLDETVARTIDVPVGEAVTVSTAGGAEALRLSGTSQTGRRVSSGAEPARAYVTQGTLARIAPNRRTWSWTMSLELAEPSKVSTYVRWLRQRYSFRQAAVAVRSPSG